MTRVLILIVLLCGACSIDHGDSSAALALDSEEMEILFESASERWEGIWNDAQTNPAIKEIVNDTTDKAQVVFCTGSPVPGGCCTFGGVFTICCVTTKSERICSFKKAPA